MKECIVKHSNKHNQSQKHSDIENKNKQSQKHSDIENKNKNAIIKSEVTNFYLYNILHMNNRILFALLFLFWFLLYAAALGIAKKQGYSQGYIDCQIRNSKYLPLFMETEEFTNFIFENQNTWDI